MQTERRTIETEGAAGASATTLMHALPLFRRTIGDSWRALIGWSVGIAGAVSLYLPLYPSVGGAQMQELLDTMPPALINSLGYSNLASGAGYAQATFYGLIGFVLLTIASTAWGTSAIAGDEETGALELTLAHGVSRSQVVLEHALALVVRVIWLIALAGLFVLLFNDSAGLGIDVGNLLAASLALLGLSLLPGATAMAVGALTGRRSWSTTAGAGVAVVSYAINAVANQSPDTDFLHAWSPYAWAFGSSPLVNGMDAGLLPLFVVDLALVAVAFVALRRRDIT